MFDDVTEEDRVEGVLGKEQRLFDRCEKKLGFGQRLPSLEEELRRNIDAAQRCCLLSSGSQNRAAAAADVEYATERCSPSRCKSDQSPCGVVALLLVIARARC